MTTRVGKDSPEEPGHPDVEGDTRARILATARKLFAERGYQRTSIREIAERLGVTKTAVLYHFPAKEDILGALSGPILDDLEAALAKVDASDAESARWQTIEGLVDVYIAHRHSLLMVLQDLALFAQEAVLPRLMGVMTKAHRLIAGPRPALSDRVRAAQAIAMLSDPVILFPATPTERLRTEVLAGVRRLYGQEVHAVSDSRRGATTKNASRKKDHSSGIADAHAKGDASEKRRSRGRPRVLTEDAIRQARHLQATGHLSMDEVAAELGVSRATLYRYLS